jgi:hypothetical protein
MWTVGIVFAGAPVADRRGARMRCLEIGPVTQHRRPGVGARHYHPKRR